MSARRATLILNPNAGGGAEPTVGQIEALMREAGYKVRIQSVKEPGWSRALKLKADLVAVAGGDGTVGRVARRLIGRDVPIAVLPTGTANNISKTLGIAALPVTQLIASWKTARRVEFDAGIARGPWGMRYFIEGVGAGLMTSSIPKVDSSKTLSQIEDKVAKVTYAQQVFRDHLEKVRAIDIDATLDGEDISGCYLLFEVLNTQYIGPNLFLAPEATRVSGDFEVVLVSEKHRKRLQDHIRHWQDGRQRPSEIVTKRGKHLEIRWRGFPLHIDDKLWPRRGVKKPASPADIAIDILPHALDFLVPEEVHEMRQLLQKERDHHEAPADE